VCLLGQTPPDEADPGFSLEQRLQSYVYRTYSWQRLSMLGADSAADHLVFDPRAWDRGPDGFACRYASSFGGRIVRNSIELGTGILFHEDVRFKASGKESFPARLRFAAFGALLGEDGQGNRRFAYSRLAATVGGILICSTWHPHPHPYQRFAEGIADSYFSHLQNSLMTEFSPDMVRFGRKMRVRVLGK
jgi:hypothetical protein